MNATAMKVEFRKFSDSIGKSAWVSVSLTHDISIADGAFSCAVYPKGVTRNQAFMVFADDLSALLDKALAKWAEHAAEYRRQMVRKMALAVIRITAECGQCTDAALRQQFAEEDVEALSADAVTDANTIAGNGPFSVVALPRGNGAPDHVEKPERLN